MKHDPVQNAPVRKNPIHSVLTTLPVVMLLAGLAFYYLAEKNQREGKLLMQHTVLLQGQYKGISAQGKSADSRRILWVSTDLGLRGGRLTAQQAAWLDELDKGALIEVAAAPRVDGSTVLWVFRVVHAGRVVFDSAVADK